MNNVLTTDCLIPTSQITFWASTTTPMFGMYCMFNPENGRLAYGGQRIAAIFAHYNNFGTDTTPNDHTGDTIITFDLNLQNVKLANSWGASHSLLQQMVFDGYEFSTASLSDAYPQNIKFQYFNGINSTSAADPKTGLLNRLPDATNDGVIPGTITGNAMGGSCGRIGGLSYIGDTGGASQFNLIYSREASGANTVNEIGYIIYNSSLDLVYYKSVNNINAGAIKSARYGKNILVAYTTLANRGTGATTCTYPAYILSTDNMYYMLIDMNGNIVVPPFPYNVSMTNSDDFEVLLSGAILWSFVNQSGYLQLNTLPPLILVVDEAAVVGLVILFSFIGIIGVCVLLIIFVPFFRKKATGVWKKTTTTFNNAKTKVTSIFVKK